MLAEAAGNQLLPSPTQSAKVNIQVFHMKCRGGMHAGSVEMLAWSSLQSWEKIEIFIRVRQVIAVVLGKGHS